MHRFHVPPDGCREGTVSLSASDCRHAVRVLRLVSGDLIEVLDGAGTIHGCRIVRADGEGVQASIVSRRSVPRPPEVVLAAALLKGKAMDLLIQKATELGVSAIQPLAAERCVARVDPEEVVGKLAGWRATAVEACKQCANPWLPRFERPMGLGAFLERRSDGLLLVASLAGEPRLPGDILRGLENLPREVTIVTGPEGDLSASELGQLAGAGAVPFTLGALVLRGETAALAALAIVQHELRILIRRANIGA